MGVTQVVMSACTTSTPSRSMTLTGTTSSVPSVMASKSGGSIRAVARSDVVALARYCTVIAFGIQRCVVGTVASISMPIAISAALHDAMACTVGRWLCTKNHFGTVDLGEARLHPQHVGEHRGEVRAPAPSRPRENSRLPAGASGEPLPHAVGGRR